MSESNGAPVLAGSVAPLSGGDKRRCQWGGLVVILLVAAGIRFAALGQESLWVDEIHSLGLAQAGGAGEILAALRNDVHPPLFFWVLHAWLRVFPATEAGARSLSAVLGVLAVAGLYGWGRALRLPRMVCLLAAALLAVHPHAVRYSQEVRMYGLETLLGVLHLLLTARVLHPAGIGGRWGWSKWGEPDTASRFRFVLGRWLPWFLVGAMLLWTHFYGVFFLAAEAVWAAAVVLRLHRQRTRCDELRTQRKERWAKWRERRGRSEGQGTNREGLQPPDEREGRRRESERGWRGWSWAPLGAVVVAGPGWAAVAWPLVAKIPERMRSGQGIDWLSRVYSLSWRTPGEVADALVCGPEIRVGPWWLHAGAVVAAVGLIFAGTMLARRSRRPVRVCGGALRRAAPALALVVLFLLPLAVSLYRLILLGGQRYMTVAAPALCLAMAVGFHRLAKRGTFAWKALAAGALLVVVVAQGLYLREYFTGREKRMWREAARFVEANARPGDVVCTVPEYSLGILDFYRPAPARPEPIDRVAALSPRPDRVWVLSVLPEGSAREKDLLDAGWKPGLNEIVHGKWASTLIRITLFRRDDQGNGQ